RVKCAVPVSGMSDLESYVTNKIINGHCDCMLMVNTYQWEWTTIAALIAPRPMLFCNSDKDSIFPMDANRRIIARLRELYAMYGKPELVDDYVSHGGHDYRPDLRVAVFKWINKHLKGDTGPVKDAEVKLIPGKELRVFPDDKDIPKDAMNGRIDEVFVPSAHVKLPVPGAYDTWKKLLLHNLRTYSFRTIPERVPEAKVIETIDEIMKSRTLVTEPGIQIAEMELGFNPKRKMAMVVAGPHRDKAFIELSAPYLRGNGEGGILMIYPRGEGDKEWTRKSPPNYVERSFALLGRTVDQGRVYDIAASIRRLNGKEGPVPGWQVVGRGQAGVLAAYAALFEPSIAEVVIIDPPVSHRAGPIFLNILRVLDIPDALGLLAPKKLTLVNARDKAFDRTVEIYKLAGAADKLTRK